MLKENNCCCIVCKVEQELRNKGIKDHADKMSSCPSANTVTLDGLDRLFRKKLAFGKIQRARFDLKSYRRTPTLCLYPASTPRSSSLTEMPNPLLIVSSVVRDGTLLPRSIKLTAVRCRPQ
jgi:hypothetical protein